MHAQAHMRVFACFSLVSWNDGWAGSIYHWFCVNVVAVLFINHKDILVAIYIGDKAFSGGVSVYHSSGAVTVGIYVLCAGGALCWWRFVIRDICSSDWLLHIRCGEAR
jgi:hypothetical protein